MSNVTNRGEFLNAIENWANQASETTIRICEQSGQKIRSEAINRTPVNTGVLRAEWQVRNERRQDGATIHIYNGAPYSAHVEYGTRPHTIYPKSKQALRFSMNGETVFAKKVNHPGSQPRPMLRPALDAVVPVLRNRLGV